MEILRANVARAGRNVANYRAIVDLFGDAGDVSGGHACTHPRRRSPQS